MERVFLVAENPLLRVALEAFLPIQSAGALTVVGTASLQQEDLESIATAAPHVVVLVVGIEAREDLRAVELIRAQAPAAGLAVIATVRCLACEDALRMGHIDALLVVEGLPDDLVSIVQQIGRHESPAA